MLNEGMHDRASQGGTFVVLLAEDEAIIRVELCDLLEMAGHTANSDSKRPLIPIGKRSSVPR